MLRSNSVALTKFRHFEVIDVTMPPGIASLKKIRIDP